MRSLSAFALLLGTAALAFAQEGRPKTAEETPPRFGVGYKGKNYSQATAKDTVQSIIEIVEKGEFNYLVAHLMDPVFVDAKLADRAKQIEPIIESNLATLREFQQKNLDKFDREVRVPVDVDKFRERVQKDARAAAFKQLVADVREKFAEDPEVLKDLRRFRSQGTFPEDGPVTAKIGAVDVKDRSLFLKKVADRWFVENKHTDDKAPEPEKK